MYILILADGRIIDAIENPVGVTWHERSGRYVTCPREVRPDGVISYDGSAVYRLEGCAGPEGKAAVTWQETDAEEYARIREELDAGEVPEEDGDEEGESEDPVLTPDEMRRIIIEQEKRLEEQAERMEFLEDCLLEMSEVVYG